MKTPDVPACEDVGFGLVSTPGWLARCVSPFFEVIYEDSVRAFLKHQGAPAHTLNKAFVGFHGGTLNRA